MILCKFIGTIQNDWWDDIKSHSMANVIYVSHQKSPFTHMYPFKHMVNRENSIMLFTTWFSSYMIYSMHWLIFKQTNTWQLSYGKWHKEFRQLIFWYISNTHGNLINIRQQYIWYSNELTFHEEKWVNFPWTICTVYHIQHILIPRSILRQTASPEWLTQMLAWNIQILTITHKQLETHGCLSSNVATDALVLKHQAISIDNAEKKTLHCIVPVSCKNIALSGNKIRR